MKSYWKIVIIISAIFSIILLSGFVPESAGLSGRIRNYLAGFGMSAAVLPNPDNTLNQELITKERSLQARELALQAREFEAENSAANDKKREYFLIFLTLASSLSLIADLLIRHAAAGNINNDEKQ